MSYLAIARKYRPATFAEIVGQEHVTTTLANAIARGRIHHAFLFCGARGVGKTTAARALAKSLNCVEGPTATPCGVCTSCLEVTSGTAPDLIEIDGASNNSVDDIRELRETVRYAPQGGRYKVYLVDEVHMLSNAAFNALLKTLEEPPPHVVFVFATTEPSKIPDTILSRVQRFDFKRIPLDGVVERLREIAEKEGATLSDTGLRMIARAGEGSMRDAQSLLDKIVSFGGPEVSDEMVAETLGLIDRSTLHRMLGAMLAGDPSTALDCIAQVDTFGHEMSRFSAELLELLRHATFVRLSDEARAHVDLPAEELDALTKLVADVEVGTLTRLFDALLDTHAEVLRASRPRIVFEMAVARLSTIEPAVPLATLLEKLEDLERRLGQGGGPPRGGGGGRGGGNGRQPSGGRMHRAPPRAPAARPRKTRAKVVRPAPDASDDDRWRAFAEGLKTMEPPAAALAAGAPQRLGDRLVVIVGSGRPLAAAARQAQLPEVRMMVDACFGRGTKLEVEASLASKSDDVAADLEALVRNDPAVQDLIRILDAKLEDVRPHREGDPE